jgi:glutamate synthase domain-containing protein 1
VCGIVGLFAKSPKIKVQLGRHLSAMLVEMSDRGPDSAGVALYRQPAVAGGSKLTVFSPDDDTDWSAVAAALESTFDKPVEVMQRASHAVIRSAVDAPAVTAVLQRLHPSLTVMSAGDTIEIFKEKGNPRDVVQRFAFDNAEGSHALGHTRMATESAVTTEHSHPFSTGLDLCLVHNGSLSNHNRLRRFLVRQGIAFQTDNDSEVAAGYLTWRLSQGANVDEALEAALRDLDGFYTFAIGSRDGFAVLRDAIACKPAVLAETDDWVAMASEYRAIAQLPGAANATIWEPAPAQIYSWTHH